VPVPNDDRRPPRRNRALAFREIASEGGLVVDSDESKVHVLNPVGSRIYAMLDGRSSRAEIVRAVVEEFDVTAEQAEADLDEFLDQLARERAVEGGGAGDE
jgi:hypothetical protein